MRSIVTPTMHSVMDWGGRGSQDENGLEEEYTHKNTDRNKLGLASRRPWQEDGSQESEGDRHQG